MDKRPLPSKVSLYDGVDSRTSTAATTLSRSDGHATNLHILSEQRVMGHAGTDLIGEVPSRSLYTVETEEGRGFTKKSSGTWVTVNSEDKAPLRLADIVSFFSQFTNDANGRRVAVEIPRAAVKSADCIALEFARSEDAAKFLAQEQPIDIWPIHRRVYLVSGRHNLPKDQKATPTPTDAEFPVRWLSKEREPVEKGFFDGLLYYLTNLV